MKTIEQIDKILGVRLVSHLTAPRIIETNSMAYPKYSVLISQRAIYSNSDIVNGYKCHILLKDKINEKVAIGRFRKISTTLASLISDRKKIDNSAIFIHGINQIFKIPRTHLGVIDYSTLEDIYKYQKYPRADIDKIHNELITIVDDLKKFKFKPQELFLIIEIPNNLPTISELFTLMRLSGKAFLDKLDGNYKLIPILELIKLLNNRDKSIFNIDTDLTNYKIHLLFKHNSKITMFSLRKLASLSMDNPEVDRKLRKYTKQKAIRVFYKYLLLFILRSADSIDELKRTEDLSKVKNNNEDEYSDDTLDELVRKANSALTTYDNINNGDSAPIDIMLEENDTVKNSKIIINNLIENDLITESRAKNLELTIKDNKKDIEDINDFKLTYNIIPDSDIIINKGLLKDTVIPLDKEYLEKIYFKQQKNTFIKLLNSAGIGIKDFNTSIENTIVNKAITYNIDMQLPGGNKKLTLIVPLPDKNGNMTINGKEYKLRKQYLDIPLKKISSTKVSIMSYSGKVFVTKGNYSRFNIGAKLYNELLKMVKENDSNIKMVVTQVDPNLHSLNLPLTYTYFSRYTRSITTKNEFFLFDYLSRDSLLLDKDKKNLNNIEGKEYTLVGNSNNGEYILMDKDGHLYIYNKGKYVNLGHIYDLLGIDRNRLPIEFASMNILGKFIPVGYTLILYYGLEKLLNISNIKYHITEDRVKSDENNIAIRFEDVTLLFERSVDSELLLGSLAYAKDLKLIKFRDLNRHSGIKDLFFFNGYDDKFIRDLIFMRSTFIDAMTEKTLEYLKLPTTFEKLLFKALELLRDDNYKNPNNIETFMFKGYERINGMIHHMLYKVLRDYNRKLGKVTVTVSISPYELYNYLNNDSTFILAEDINPIKQAMQKEEFTMTGMFGRTKDTVTMKDRVIDPSAIGIISEATKDSSDVGVTAYFSATPNIDNLLGLPKEVKEIDSHNIFSGSALLAQFSNKDDGKRTLYTSIQNQHVVPIKTQRILPLLSGYELVLPYKVEEKYAIHAKKSGKVSKVTNKLLEVTYDDGTKDKFRLRSWFSKEVGGISYKHNITTMLKEGERFKEGDNLTYDEAFFGPLYLEKHRVAYKWGNLVNVFYTESSDVFEDSNRVSKKFAEKFTTNISSVRDKVVTIYEQIIEPKQIGERVKYNDPLFIIAPMDEDIDNDKLNKQSIDILKDLNRMKFKAKSKGIIRNIEVFYNVDLKSINSPSLLKLIKDSDKRMLEDKGVTGKVDNKFSHKGRPIGEDEILIIYYIEKELKFLMGDKISIGNQLKTTNGGIFNSIVSESGIELDMEFGETSDAARIVLSPLYQGILNRILLKAQKDIVELYNK